MHQSLAMKYPGFYVFCFSIWPSAQENKWPLIKHCEGRFTAKIAMPVGGIGTGNISIGGNGQWRDVGDHE